ncbi:helix-turn-helix transcriptional regulator [Intestinibacter sp.]|uniref:helix-turn-helix transcriptional regulator n=1 Tax=Intestinibacter sp. TaxID=1965304 RepID=UPI002A7617B3|nr:helix-turn-helix transcriptional regulator [Intestinibacter sp.]MDY2734892.1 helix-turn-helix transcriptional regulator [Intestinibacter sp.]
MNKLRELRHQKKMKQSEVAKIVGISQQAYSYFELGLSKPSLDTAKRIADFYKKPIEEIFFSKLDN